MFASAPEPLVIQISGALQGVVDIASNKTLDGTGGGSLQGGLRIVGPDEGELISNVIIHDLTLIGECTEGQCDRFDALSVYRAHHVWIDHCDISDGPDGNVDVTAESDYVTISWNRFSYSSSDGDNRSNLIGGDDGAVADDDDLGVTLHHNWWADNVRERAPRVRFGPVHVFNNYYTTTLDLYCIRPGVSADLLVENNFFDGPQRPFDTTDPSAVINASGNGFGGRTPTTEPNEGSAFTPPYPYELDAAEDVPSIVQAGVGPR